MNDIEQKALALAIEAREDDEMRLCPDPTLLFSNWEALCRAIEQHEAFKQKVSYAIEDVTDRDLPVAVLRRFIIGADKPDALVDVWGDLFVKSYNLDQFCDALEARGLEIRSKTDD